jgi:glycosyltransferase involved in cell wall biosynthesis
VERDIEAFRPDVIHVECAERMFMGFLARAGVGLARRKKIASSAIYHTNYLDYIEDFKKQIVWMRIPGVVDVLRRVFAWVYNSYDVTMVPGQAMQAYLKRWGFRHTMVDYFNGVDVETFKPAPGARQSDKVTILYAGRFTADKQVATLLEALTLAAEGRSNLRFILVGDGPEREKIAAWAQAHPGTLLPGRVPYEQMSRYYQMADIFATASKRENRPLSIQEAMACGLAVVAPAAGGIVDQVRPGETGLLVKPDDPQGLAQALTSLIEQPELRRRLGEAARMEVENFRTWEYSARATIEIWEGLLSRKAVQA